MDGSVFFGTFYEKELQKTNQQEFSIEKVIKRKGSKLYVKWKRYDNSFNSWIDKKDLVWFSHIKIFFQNHINNSVEVLKLYLIFQIMQ